MATLAMIVLAMPAGAFPLRPIQVPFQNASLQGILDGFDGGVNTATAQLDAQVFRSSATGNTNFILGIKLGAVDRPNTIGVYNAAADVPELYPVFPDSATAGYSVACKFFGPGPYAGKLAVVLFDEMENVVGTTLYTGVTRDAFGFYIQGPGGTFFSQDVRNGCLPQLLTYQGTGFNTLDHWLCFNDTPYAPGASTFDSAVLQVYWPLPFGGTPSSTGGFQATACAPTPTAISTWGRLKAIYR